MGQKKETVSPKTVLMFNIFIALIQKKILRERYGKEKTDAWLKKSRGIFKSLYKKMPDIGGRDNMLYKNLVMSTFLMPMALVMKKEGLPTREIGEHIFNVAERSNELFLPLMKRMSYTDKSQVEKMRLAAKRSLDRKYPGDWVFEFVEGGDKYLYGYDIRECAIHKFWRDQGLEDLVPYLCLTDWAKWKTMGVSVDRTKTVANGGDLCDFRYLREKVECPSGWPPESNIEWTGKFERGR